MELFSLGLGFLVGIIWGVLLAPWFYAAWASRRAGWRVVAPRPQLLRPGPPGPGSAKGFRHLRLVHPAPRPCPGLAEARNGGKLLDHPSLDL